ncbi:MAG: ParB/RepB/Spo0J family partition protein [Bacteroidota bacterium]
MSSLSQLPIALLCDSLWHGRYIPKVYNPDEFHEKSMKQLVESIRKKGLMTLTVVRVVNGHRRVEAYRTLGKEIIEALIWEYSDEEALVFSVMENILRRNLGIIKKAIAFHNVLNEGLFKDKKAFSKSIRKDEIYVGKVMNLSLLDQRIIYDLVTNHTTEMSIYSEQFFAPIKPKTTTPTISWELYQKVIKESISRKDIAMLLKSSNKYRLTEPRIEFKRRKIIINLPESWSEERKEELRSWVKKRD